MNKKFFLIMASLSIMLTPSFFLFSATSQTGSNIEIQSSQTSSTNQARADRMTRQSINNAFMKDRDISSNMANMSVDVQNGVVRLNGTVNSDAVKSKMEDKARNIVGVSKVVNNLKVKK